MSSLPPKKRVFIVDDEVGFTRLLRLTLEKTGSYLVREENHGPNALESAKSFRPDIIFLDVVMPELEGGEIAKILRAEPTLASVPIVFLTAIVSQRETRTDIQGFPFLAKPVSMSTITACIEERTASAGVSES